MIGLFKSMILNWLMVVLSFWESLILMPYLFKSTCFGDIWKAFTPLTSRLLFFFVAALLSFSSEYSVRDKEGSGESILIWGLDFFKSVGFGYIWFYGEERELLAEWDRFSKEILSLDYESWRDSNCYLSYWFESLLGFFDLLPDVF